MAKWGVLFLAVGRREEAQAEEVLLANYLELADFMTSRIRLLHANFVAGSCSSQEKAELSLLCELFSSCRVVVGEGMVVVVPLLHTLNGDELFDALISRPLALMPAASLSPPKLLLIDGLDVTFDCIGGATVLRFIRLIARMGPHEGMRVVMTCRCHSDDLLKEIAGLHPHVVHLHGDNHSNDVKEICRHFLAAKAYGPVAI